MFGELVVIELKTLNQKLFLLAKQKIQNTFFKNGTQTLEVDSNGRSTVQK